MKKTSGRENRANRVLSWWTHVVRLFVFGTLLIVAGPHGAAAGQPLDQSVSVDIPAYTPLENALIEVGIKAGLTVMIDSHVVEQKRTPRLIRGTMSVRQALAEILSDSELSYSESGDQLRVVPSAISARRTSAGDDHPLRVGSLSDQQAISLDSRDPGLASNDQLQQVTVSAQRRDQNVDEVPISIAALDQRTMDDLNIQSVADLASVVPGLTISPAGPSPDYGEIAIRGITNAAAGNTAPTTQLYIDQTPIAIRELSDAYSKSPWPSIFDLDRVEVLRGPQGTLFGASAMGGAIRFITPQPRFTQVSARAKAEIGFTDHGDPTYEVGGAYGAPLVEGVAGFRISAWYQNQGGFIDRVDAYTGQTVKKNANNSDTYVVRPAIAWQPLENLTITGAFFLDRTNIRNPDEYWVTEVPTPPGKHAWGGFAQPYSDNLRVSSLDVKYDFSWASLASDTSYMSRSSLATEDVTAIYSFAFTGTNPLVPELASYPLYNLNVSSTRAWQEELRLSSRESPTSRVTWLVGAFFRNAVQNLQQLENDISPLTSAEFGLTSDQLVPGVSNYPFHGQFLSGYANWSTTDNSKAIFGDIALKLLPPLTIDVGARVERVSVLDQKQFVAGPLTGTSSASQVLPDAKSTPVTPRASVTYQITPENMVYVSVAKGFRPGGGNSASLNTNPLCQQSLNQLGLTETPLSFDPDSLWSYEIGTKDTFFDHHLSIEASAYHVKWSDIQTTVGLASCEAGFIRNQGEVISNGFDLQLTAKVTDHLSFGGTVGYTDAYYPYAAYGSPDQSGQGPLLNAAGDKFGVPWAAAVNAQYDLDLSPIWSDARSYIRFDYRWQDSTPWANPKLAFYDPAVAEGQPAYGVLNIRVGLTRGGLDLSAFVNNVTNADPRLGYTDLGLRGDPLFYAAALRPRTAGVTMWYRFH
jgi:iron complex outermembrane recepter protein